MTEDVSRRALPGLRRYLLYWFAGCAIVMAIAYAQLLEYYLELGINLRTQSFLERTAEGYVQATNGGARQDLPSGPSLAGYLDLAEMPPQMLGVFSLDGLQHGEAQRFVNLDFDADDEKEFAVETGDFCPEGTCELIFLYPYKLDDAV